VSKNARLFLNLTANRKNWLKEYPGNIKGTRILRGRIKLLNLISLVICYSGFMPEKQRIDAPEAVHYVIARGMCRRFINKGVDYGKTD